MELALLSNLDFVKFVDVSGLFPAILISILTYVIMRLTRNGLNQLGEQYTQRRLLIKQASVFIQFIMLILGGFWAI